MKPETPSLLTLIPGSSIDPGTDIGTSPRNEATSGIEVTDDTPQVSRPRSKPGFKLEPEDLMTAGKDDRMRRPDGKFLSRYEEEAVLAHERQIRQGLKGWLAENQLVTIDPRNRARDASTGKRLTNVQLLKISDTADFSREARRERLIGQVDTSKRWIELDPETCVEIPHRQAESRAAAKEVTEPSAGIRSENQAPGIRGRIHGRWLRLTAAYNGFFDKLTERVVEHPGGDLSASHVPIRTLARDKVSQAYWSTVTATDQARNRAVEYFSDQDKGERRRAVAVVIGVAVVAAGAYLSLKGLRNGNSGGQPGNAHGASDAAQPVPGSSGGGSHEGSDAAHPVPGTGGGHGHNHEQAAKVLSLKAPRGGVHDSIWREMSRVARNNHSGIKPDRFAHLVGRVLDYNHLTWTEARDLPIGFRFKIPEEVLDELTKSKKRAG